MENTQQTIIVKTQKSAGTAALLAFLFGPIGMLYSTLTGALIMFIVTGIVIFITAGIGLIITIPICTIWAYMKVKNDNEKDSVTTITSNPNSTSKEKADENGLFD